MRFSPMSLAAGLITALATPASADLSADIGAQGITATIQQLEALPAPTDADRFTLGGLHFLGAIEGALQARWRYGVTEEMQMLPLLRLPIQENPAPEPFAPQVIAQIFTDVSAGMDQARAPLAEIPDTSDFVVEIALKDLWFDVNANATRDDGEDLADVAGLMIMGWRWNERGQTEALPIIRFDVADAAWLSAYTHLLGGVSDVILAYDPTQAIAEVGQASAQLEALRTLPVSEYDDLGASFGSAIDMAAMVLRAMDQTPDAARAASAQAHFLAMVADNRIFWDRVARETDNDLEWLPNDGQQSALGIDLPPGTGTAWVGVLTEFEAVLTGEALVPYWRTDAGAGVNVARLFTDPRAIDLVGWIQGIDALPYLEQGRVVDDAVFNQFLDVVGGEPMLMVLFLN